MTGVAAPYGAPALVEATERSPRRVLWVTKGLGRGGAERLAVSCARHFDRWRFRVDVAYVLPYKDAFVSELRDAGIDVYCVGGDDVAGWVRRLVDLARHGGYDLVHTHSPVPALPLRALPPGTRPPLVHTEHNVWDRYRRPTRIVNAVTYAANVSVLAVSDGVRSSLRRPPLIPRPWFPRAVTLHHGIDPDTAIRGPQARATARRALGVPDDVPVIGTVGNLTPKKDHVSLLSAVARLLPGHPGLRLVIVGSGPLDHELRRRTSDAGIRDHVVFTGSRDDVPALLPAFDVFALSSLHEGLSIALLEAMASGIPPVATAVGGVPEVVNHGVNGLLVTPRSVRHLADGLRRLLSDSDLRSDLGRAAERRSRDFGIDRAVRFMEDWYEQVLS